MTEIIARDLLATRREHDTCNGGECFYPTVVALAEAYIALSARVATLEQAADALSVIAEAALAALDKQEPR